jgi:hypothetical protein
MAECDLIAAGGQSLVLIQEATSIFLRSTHPSVALQALSIAYKVPTLPAAIFSLNRSVYNRQMSEYRAKIAGLRAGYFITLWRFDIGQAYHDVALAIYPGGIEVFDSMVSGAEYGPYTKRIVQTVYQVFNPPDLAVTGGNTKSCLQYTGGDPAERPLCWTRQKKSALLCAYHPEAQNRFSWGWSLFYLHCRLQDLDINNQTTGLSPLIVVKRYLYGLAKSKLLGPNVILMPHFTKVWDAPGSYDRSKT